VIRPLPHGKRIRAVTQKKKHQCRRYRYQRKVNSRRKLGLDTKQSKTNPSNKKFPTFQCRKKRGVSLKTGVVEGAIKKSKGFRERGRRSLRGRPFHWKKPPEQNETCVHDSALSPSKAPIRRAKTLVGLYT